MRVGKSGKRKITNVDVLSKSIDIALDEFGETKDRIVNVKTINQLIECDNKIQECQNKLNDLLYEIEEQIRINI